MTSFNINPDCEKRVYDFLNGNDQNSLSLVCKARYQLSLEYTTEALGIIKKTDFIQFRFSKRDLKKIVPNPTIRQELSFYLADFWYNMLLAGETFGNLKDDLQISRRNGMPEIPEYKKLISYYRRKLPLVKLRIQRSLDKLNSPSYGAFAYDGHRTFSVKDMRTFSRSMFQKVETVLQQNPFVQHLKLNPYSIHPKFGQLDLETLCILVVDQELPVQFKYSSIPLIRFF